MDRRRLWIPLIALFSIALTGQAPPPDTGTAPGDDIRQAGETVDVMAQGADDVMAAGRRVTVAGTVTDNVLAAGRNVTLDADIGGDALMAGQDVRVSGRVARNLFAAGQDVTLSAPVEGDVFAAGGEIVLPESASVRGDVTLAGGEIVLSGPVGGHARLAGGEIRLNSGIAGNVDVAANELTLGPSARIAGRLVVRSPEPPEVARGAQVAGGIEHIAVTGREEGAGLGTLVGFWLAGTLGTWLVGLILFALAPNVARAASARLRENPLMTFLLGFAIALLGLPLAILMAVTIVGLPFAIATFGAWLFALAVAVPVLALTLAVNRAERRGDGEAPRARTIALPLLVILGVLVAVGMIPVAGQILLGVAALFGVGTLGQALTASRRRWRGAPVYA